MLADSFVNDAAIKVISYQYIICFAEVQVSTVWPCQKPTEANISSMSSWPSHSVFWAVASSIILLVWYFSDSSITDNSVRLLRLFSCFFFTPLLIVENFDRLLSAWKRVLRWAFLLAADWQVFRIGPWGVKVQQTSCPKIRNFLCKLRMKTIYRNIHNVYCFMPPHLYIL